MCSLCSNSKGAEEAHRALPNEALYGDLRILGLIIPAYLQVFLQVVLRVSLQVIREYPRMTEEITQKK